FKPPVVITGITVLGDPYVTDRPYDQIKDLSLDYDQGFAEIQFDHLAFYASDRQVFEYQIDGVSDRWLRGNSTVNLAGLDDGRYTVHMRVRNPHGGATPQINARLR